ncbi:MAG: insulinase family protein [Bacteroidia bacterium]|nr:insulinase family protein [Bacteroidia bacterium]
MPNRSAPPPIANVNRVPFPEHTEYFMVGKVPVVRLQSDSYSVVKIEIIFDAGRLYESKRSVGKATNLLLKSGTLSKTIKEINETIDYHGATISLPVNFDHSSIVLYCLSKYVSQLLPLVFEILTQPVFPQKEFEFFTEQQKSKLKVALQNVDNQAYRIITEQIFGKGHPYGYNSSLEDYDLMTRDDLIRHHRQLYHLDNCRVFISGNMSDSDFRSLEEMLGTIPSGKKPSLCPQHEPLAKPAKIKTPFDGKVQSAIKIGRKTFNRQHEHYQQLYILNTLLGGYFGSRLSMNIREKRGFTYGIHSSLDAMAHDGCLIISTEVANTYVEPTLKAIYEEIDDLKTKLVNDLELQQMRSYLMGYFLNSVDGVFRSSTVIRGLKENGVGKEFFNSIQDQLMSISAKDIRNMANQYLQKDDLWEVVVG